MMACVSTETPIDPADLAAALRVTPGAVDLTTRPTGGTPGFAGGKTEGKRVLAGLAEPLGDLQERLFAEGLSGVERTSTEVGPWHVVPADREWFRNLAVGHLLLAMLQEMAPQWPGADLVVEEQRGRLLAEQA